MLKKKTEHTTKVLEVDATKELAVRKSTVHIMIKEGGGSAISQFSTPFLQRGKRGGRKAIFLST